MGEIHELFVLALSLVWFAGATPDSPTVELNGNPEFPGSFPDFPGSSPTSPKVPRTSPGGQPLSLRSLTPPSGSQNLPLMDGRFAALAHGGMVHAWCGLSVFVDCMCISLSPRLRSQIILVCWAGSAYPPQKKQNKH